MNERPDDLTRAMALLAAEHRAARAPAGVERAVLAEFDTARRRRRDGVLAAALAIAATLVAGTALIREHPASRPLAMAPVAMARAVAPTAVVASTPVVKSRPGKREVVPRSVAPRTVAPSTEPAERPFITIPYTVPLAPGESATVVRMTLSPSAMAVAGFPLPAIGSIGGTEADVLVSEDGRARAIRIVANSNFR